MRAIQIDRFGEPEEVLVVREVPMPEPGPGQILIRMRARPVNPSILFMIRGMYGQLPALPAVPGNEGVGVVERLGAGVTSLAEGQQVVPFGGETWQEYVVAEADSVIPLPPDLSEAQASMLIVNPTSAWLMLEDELKVQPGEWILQNAANSAVGRFVIQIARMKGYRTINVVRRRDVIGELKEAGADEVICEADEDVVARVQEITGGKGVPYALESVGGGSGSRLAAALGPGGTMLVFGRVGGQPLTIDGGPLLFRGAAVKGWWLTRWFGQATPEQRAELFGTLIPLFVEGKLHAPVGGEYDLADVVAAVRESESGRKSGKILLVG
ncbi:MAG: zinc-dependent alcohol dehydrogenase family protein [Gemmatimonadota bacterium]